MSLFVSQGAESVVPMGWVLGGMTFFFLATFIGWAVWAWLPANHKAFDEAARMPLEDA